MIRLARFLQFDPADPADLEDFVKWLFGTCLWIFVVLSGIIMIAAILKAGDGGLPPEPQWWIEFEQSIGVTW